ncbi:MAG: hypothetical protein FJ096_13045 [Deltaproteobacteria bacterium]|nr:hypothetical protein [Deltaproteobacteria bacterium]
MRLLHLVDRLDARGTRVRDTILRLEGRHANLVASGTPVHDVAPFERVRVDGLRASSSMPVTEELDALVTSFAPDHVVLHSVVNATALAWAASKRGILVVTDLRAFHPERAIGVERGPAKPGARPLCASCFETDPFFRGLRDEAQRRRAALSGARAVLVDEEAAAVELGGLGVDAPLRVVAPEPRRRAAWLDAELGAREPRGIDAIDSLT